MGMSYEFERNIIDARERKDFRAVKTWEDLRGVFKSLVQAGTVTELPQEYKQSRYVVSDMPILQITRRPLHVDIAASLKDRIEGNLYKYGEQIPPVEKLKKEFGVSKITMSAAEKLLEQQGYLRIRMGSGTFVTYIKEETESGGDSTPSL